MDFAAREFVRLSAHIARVCLTIENGALGFAPFPIQ